jgi:hypothetical protein
VRIREKRGRLRTTRSVYDRLPLDLPKRRLAQNEALFREVNERVRSLEAGQHERGADFDEFFCECPNLDCTIRVKLTRGEYESARAESKRFIICPGHQRQDLERILLATARYFLVEKKGEAGDEAERRDPGD